MDRVQLTDDSSVRQVFSVSDITRNVRFLLEENFPAVWVEGEISNFKFHTSGHMYFTLKDAQAQLACVMFARENGQLSFELTEGLKVLCFGRISLYAPRGQYQLYIEKVEPKGAGALGLRFEQLKKRLADEGLFDLVRKKPIPFLPKSIGIVTSIDGAALRDILHVLERRFLPAHVVVYPVAVQGALAAGQIAQAVEDFNRLRNVEVLIVTRGGGSLEDLWAFNEEIVARAICQSSIPVISAVGHEIDFTIADFAADLRAATPSAAAELVLPEQAALLDRLIELRQRADRFMKSVLSDYREDLRRLSECRALLDPLALFDMTRQRLDEWKRILDLKISALLELEKERFSALIGKLESLGPTGILRRGFSVCTRLADGVVVKDTADLQIGELVRTTLFKGTFTSTVKQTQAV